MKLNFLTPLLIMALSPGLTYGAGENAKYSHGVLSSTEDEDDFEIHTDAVWANVDVEMPEGNAISEFYVRIESLTGEDLEIDDFISVHAVDRKFFGDDQILAVFTTAENDFWSNSISRVSRSEVVAVKLFVDDTETSFNEDVEFRVVLKGNDALDKVGRVEFGVTHHPTEQDKMPDLYGASDSFPGGTGLYVVKEELGDNLRANAAPTLPHYEVSKLDENVENIVIFVHGWNPDDNRNPYLPTEDSINDDDPKKSNGTRAFQRITNSYLNSQVLEDGLLHKVDDCLEGLNVCHYFWNNDAATGGANLDSIANSNASRNGSCAHGLKLGREIRRYYPNLKRVQFIAHSAGNWAARRASAYLQISNPNILIEHCALDPFVNDFDDDDVTNVIDRRRTLGGDINHVPAFEMTSSWADQTVNIYAIDLGFAESDWINEWTSGNFSGWTVSGYNIENDSKYFEGWMDSHAGPIGWYSSTAVALVTGTEDPPFAFEGFGSSIWNSLEIECQGPLDLMFVIDTSGSMGDDIAAVKNDIVDIINTTESSNSDVRFGVVEFKDLRCDNPAIRTVVSLTADTDVVINGVNSMGASGGCDEGESQLSGITHALDGNAGAWRGNPVKKAIILMTDEPADDPEFQTGYTKADILARVTTGAFEFTEEDVEESQPLLARALKTTDDAIGEADENPEIIEIYGVWIGSDTSAQDDLDILAAGSSGQVFSAATANEVVDAIIDIIDVIGGGSLMTVQSTGDITLNAQTGLYEQQVTFENLSGSDVTGFRVFVENLPDGVRVQNAHGEESERQFIDYRDLVSVDGTVSFTLEYYSSNRVQPVENPTFTVVAAGDPFTEPDGSLATQLDPRVVMEDDHSVLLEFLTASDKEYLIQYSYDLAVWKTVASTISGTGERVQWLDNGPPKTDCHPSDCETRYYRLIERDLVDPE